MQTIFSRMAFFEFYQDLAGWAVFLFSGTALVIFAVRQKRLQPQASRSFWIILIICLLMIPAAGSIAGFELPSGNGLPPPGIPFDPPPPLLLVFAFVPAFLAAGILGPGPGLLVGALTGAWIGLFQSHNLFTVVEYGLLSLLFSWAVNQRYRTWSYSLLRNPLISAGLLVVLYPAINTLSNAILYAQPLVLRIDYALSRVLMESAAVAGALIAAGLISFLVSLLIPQFWMINNRLEPSPSELKIETRFAYRFGPLALFFVLALLWGDWIVAGEAAENLLYDRMESIGVTAAESIPPFLETGQSFLLEITDDPAVRSEDSAQISQALNHQIRQIPYFYQLTLIKDDLQVAAGYPQADPDINNFSRQSLAGLELIFARGIPFQQYTAAPVPGGVAARLVMMAPVYDQSGEILYALVGETGLDSNPYSDSILTNLRNITDIGGFGILIDSEGRILFHPVRALLFKTYSGQIKYQEDSFSELSPIGTRNIIYSRPVESLPWTVVVSIPAEQATQLSLDIAVPLFLILLVAIIVAIVLVRLAMRGVTRPIQQLADEARQISSGVLTREVKVQGVDEVGTLGNVFEQMRLSLRANLQEIQRILTVSQGVAASLNMSEAALPILKAATAYGASSARIVLSRNALPEYHQGMPTRFGVGPHHEEYRIFDEQIWKLTQQQSEIILTNPRRAGIGEVSADNIPEALIAVALQYEMVNYGALWIAYDQPHKFTEEESRFLSAIGGQTALAAANTALYQRHQLGHQRLETVIKSTPDAVLVTDREGRLVLSNPAAWHLLNQGEPFRENYSIDEQIPQGDLLGMLQSQESGPHYLEIEFPEDKIFQAVAVETRTLEGYMGKVCILHDITHFKEVEEIKTEFVSTVSHNLLSPLSMIQGFTSMVGAVGQINPQQEKFLADINQNIDDMIRIVNNLLDMRRVESGVNLDKEEFNFRELLEQVINRQKLLANQQRIKIINASKQKDTIIHADRTLVESAINNLLNNAVRFNKANGNITIDYQIKNNKFECSIADTGIGISEIDRERIFDQFYQVIKNSEGEGGGSGLGLTIVKNAVERHGGKIRLDSDLGKGSVFYFNIPQ